MSRLALAWQHRSEAAVLIAALALSLAACLPAANALYSDCSPWRRNAVVPSQSEVIPALVRPQILGSDDWWVRGSSQARAVGVGQATGSLLPHAPVVILSDQDFISQGWPGAGTAQNPYLIENLEITFPTGNCIEIRSTHAHFRVRSCSLTAGTQTCGVKLRDVVNGVLEINTCVAGVSGIWIENSQDCQVVGNTCPMGVYGVRLSYCDSINVTDNICQASSTTGIRIYESQRTNTARNLCTGGWYGIEVYGGTGNDVSENICRGNAGIVLNATRMVAASLNYCPSNSIGIWLQDTSDCTLTQNTCEGNINCGVLLARSLFNDLANNVIRGNQRGIEIRNGVSNYVAGNLLEGNGESGIYLYLSQSNRVEVNTISGGAYGVHAVASNNNVLAGNSLLNSTEAGILLVESGMSTITDNTFLLCGLELQGETYLAQAEVRDNTVNGAPLAYLQNQLGATVPAGAGQVILLGCRSVSMDHQTLTQTAIGLLIFYCRFATIEDCVFAENRRCGVEVWWSRGIVFSKNVFRANGECGLLLHADCSDNAVRESLFADNTLHNAVDDGALNIFDRNFWSDYVGFDRDLDGLGDDPYQVSGLAMNHDFNPLMAPPGFASPAHFVRWVLGVAEALVVNSLIIGIGLGLVFRFRKSRLISARKS